MCTPVQYLKTAVFLVLFWPLLLSGQTEGPKAVILEIEGVIGPATSDYVKRNMEKATNQGVSLVVLRMDTPGGLDSSMRQIIRNILDSRVPVVSYVSPSGARAASAGTYILYASHVATMAPATNLGAATPVQISTPMSPQTPEQKNKEPKSGDSMQQKIINDASAYIRGLAEMRGRNAEWAEKAVREAASLTATEALKLNVINFIATDLSDLLSQIDGLKLNVLGQEITLETKGMLVERVAPDWRSRLLAIISDPNIAYVLMMIGLYGLIYELANPGMILPGVVGAICLLLALFAFQVLPINYAGLALILIGIGFMVAEIFVPSFGALGIGGVVAFVFGSVILLDSDVPGYQVSWPLIGTFALSSAGFFMFVIKMMLRARRQPVVSGEEELIGSVGEVLEDFSQGKGRIRLHSESWRAQSRQPVKRGQQVKVVSRNGLVLQVEPTTELSAPLTIQRKGEAT